MRTPGWGQGHQDEDPRVGMGTLELGCVDLLTSSIKGPRAASSHHTDLGTPQWRHPQGVMTASSHCKVLGSPSDPSVATGSLFGSPRQAGSSASTGHLGDNGSGTGMPHSHAGTPRHSGRLWEWGLQEEHTKILIPKSRNPTIPLTILWPFCIITTTFNFWGTGNAPPEHQKGLRDVEGAGGTPKPQSCYSMVPEFLDLTHEPLASLHNSNHFYH